MLLNHGSAKPNAGSSSQAAPSPSPPQSGLQSHEQPRAPSQSAFSTPYDRQDEASATPNEYRNQQMPPSIDPSVPLTKPVQQLVTSPVDKWGLAALLRLIRAGADSDLLALSLGEDLATL